MAAHQPARASVSPDADDEAATARLAEVFLYRRSAWGKARRAVAQAALIAAMVYIVTVAFNLVDAVRAGTLGRSGALSHALILDALPALLPQLRNAGPEAAGAVALAVALGMAAPYLYYWRRRRQAGRKLRGRQELVRWWARTADGVSLDDLDSPEVSQAWLRRELDDDAPRRLGRLRQVEAWTRDDPLLAEWIADHLAWRDRLRTVLLAVAGPTGAVILARLLLLLVAC